MVNVVINKINSTLLIDTYLLMTEILWKLFVNFRLETLIKKFADNELQYTNTIIDETYIKALTGNYKFYFYLNIKHTLLITYFCC